MVSGRRLADGLMVAALAVAGCRSAPPATAPPSRVTQYRPSPPATVLPAVQPASLEPDATTLPVTDPLAQVVASGPPAGVVFRGLTESQCRELAALHAPFAGPLEPPSDPSACSPVDSMMHEVRTHAADAARNRAAMEALDRYFRLSDAEARGQVLRDAVPKLDEIRSDVKSAREKGLRVPIEPADLDRQRAMLVGLVGQSDLAVAVLNIELKRRIGHAGAGPERLWPVGPFPVSAAAIDVEAGVRVALERRGDLRMLRAVHARLTPETLTAVREVLGEKVREHVPDPLAGFPHLKRIADRRKPPSSASPSAETLAELAAFRQHLADQIAAKEREAADDVRSAAAAVTAAVHQVALSKWQAEQLAAKAADAAERGPLVEKPARLEALRARADVAGAVYAWHAARVRLLAAQGVLPDPAP